MGSSKGVPHREQDRAVETAVAGRYLPALDGLRALAICGVFAYHLGYGWASGGFLGVDLFFVLSGYLITSLLVEEYLEHGNLHFAGFWGRRARRLLPALLVMLVAVVVFVSVSSAGLPIDWNELRTQALATVGYFANWQLLFSHQSYFDRFAVQSPFKHTWSLGIEEQFYLVWPLVIAALMHFAPGHTDPGGDTGRGGGTDPGGDTGRGGGTGRGGDTGRFGRLGRLGRWLSWRRAGLVLTIGGAAASAAWMAVLWTDGAGVDRVYYGTDTRAFDLLIGAAVAMSAAGLAQPSARVRRALHVASFGALGVLAVCWTTAGLPNANPRPWMFEGGLLLCAVAAGVVVSDVRLLDRGPLARALSVAPIRYIGRISYGLYLWHWPVIVELSPERTHMSGLALTALRIGVTLGLAVVSFHLIEQPIRHGWPAIRPTWARGALVPVSMAAAAGAVFLATVPPAVATASAGQVVRTVEVGNHTTADAVPGAGGAVGERIRLGFRPSAHHPLRILLLGDSVMLSESPAVEALFDSTHSAVVENHSQWGFGLTTLKGWQSQVPQWIHAARPDLIVAMWSWDNTALAAHSVAYTAELESFVRLVLQHGDGVKGVIFQQFPAPGTQLATVGEPDYPARVAKLINRFDALAASLTKVFPHRVMYLPLAAAVLRNGHFATWLPPEGRPKAPKADWLRVRQVDNVHFCPAGAARYAAALLADLTPMFHLRAPSAGWLHGSWTNNYLAYRYPNADVCPDDHP